MTVTSQYAESHLDELLSATEEGQQVDITRPHKPAVRLTLVSESGKIDRTGLIGSGKGKIWYADDWDSDETNEEIARLFNESPLFPDEP